MRHLGERFSCSDAKFPSWADMEECLSVIFLRKKWAALYPPLFSKSFVYRNTIFFGGGFMYTPYYNLGEKVNGSLHPQFFCHSGGGGGGGMESGCARLGELARFPSIFFRQLFFDKL